MSITVRTKQELKAAVKRKEKSIIIADPELAQHVRKLKTAKKLTKWTIGLLIAGGGAGIIGLALAPATGGASAGVGGMMFCLSAEGAAVASGGGISVAAAVAIGSLAILGVVVIFAIWKDYDIRIAKLGPIEGIELFRK